MGGVGGGGGGGVWGGGGGGGNLLLEYIIEWGGSLFQIGEMKYK